MTWDSHRGHLAEGKLFVVGICNSNAIEMSALSPNRLSKTLIKLVSLLLEWRKVTVPFWTQKEKNIAF